MIMKKYTYKIKAILLNAISMKILETNEGREMNASNCNIFLMIIASIMIL